MSPSQVDRLCRFLTVLGNQPRVPERAVGQSRSITRPSTPRVTNIARTQRGQLPCGRGSRCHERRRPQPSRRGRSYEMVWGALRESVRTMDGRRLRRRARCRSRRSIRFPPRRPDGSSRCAACCQRLDPRLAGGVGTHQQDLCDCGDRCDGENVALSLDHVRKAGPDRPPSSEQVDLDHALKGLVVDRPNRSGRGYAGVRDQDVDPPEPLDRSGHCRIDGLISRTSTSKHAVSGPQLPATRASPSGSSPTSESRAPRAARRRAHSAPMPLAAPVIRTVLFATE
jgi:hypothetical protein